MLNFHWNLHLNFSNKKVIISGGDCHAIGIQLIQLNTETTNNNKTDAFKVVNMVYVLINTDQS